MKLGVRTKLFLLLLALIIAAVVVVDLYLSNALDRQLSDRIRDDLLVRAVLVADRVESMAAAGDEAAWDAIADELGRLSQSRVTLVRRDGIVLGDSEVETRALSALDNHSGRPEILAALDGGQGFSVRYSMTVGQRMMYVAAPFRRGEAVYGIARVATPLTDVDEAVLELHKTIALASLVALAVAIMMSTVAADLTSRRLRQITDAARRMAEGNLAVHTRISGHDEISVLGEALNRLAESLSATMERLRSERDLLNAVLAGMQEGILVVGADGRILLVNPALREMLLLESDCTGKSVLQAIRNAELSALVERVRLRADGSAEIEVSGFKPRRVLVKGVKPVDLHGGVLAVFLDVTELRRLESVRREFVANASHELRTPVAAVRAAAETLRQALDDRDAAQRFTGIIERNSERLERLVEDLLELSRIESREFRLRVEPVDLGEAARSAIALHRDRAQQKGIALEAALPTDAVAVRADRRALELIFGNLLDNAVKYCPEHARVTVDTVCRGETVYVSVSDNGPGIEPQHLPRLFERFYRVDAGRSRELGGTGLGLAIVKHLVEAMGGTVGVESTVGAGTSFHFSLLRV